MGRLSKPTGHGGAKLEELRSEGSRITCVSASERKHRPRRGAQSSRANVRNLYGAEHCLGMLGAVAIAGHHNPQGTASVNPIFTSVRLAHRVPVRRLRRYKPSHYRVRRSSEAIVAKWSISRLCLAVVFIER